jgi:hypothetical protein
VYLSNAARANKSVGITLFSGADLQN